MVLFTKSVWINCITYSVLYCVSYIYKLKPVFHCSAKSFALGPHVGIPTCQYQKMPTPNANQWNIVCVPCVWSRVGHVHFIVFVSISFAFGSQLPVKYWLKGYFKNILFYQTFKGPLFCAFLAQRSEWMVNVEDSLPYKYVEN